MLKALDYRKVEEKFKNYKPFSFTPSGRLQIDFSLKIKGIGNDVDFKITFIKKENALCLSTWEFSCLTQVGDTRKRTILSILSELLFKDGKLDHDIIENNSIHLAKHADVENFSRFNNDNAKLYVFDYIDSTNFIEIAQTKQYEKHYGDREWFSFFYDEEQKILAFKTNKKAPINSKNPSDFEGIQQIHFSLKEDGNIHYGVNGEGDIYIYKKDIEKKDILLFNIFNRRFPESNLLELRAVVLSGDDYLQERFSLLDIKDELDSNPSKKSYFEMYNEFSLDDLTLPFKTEHFTILHELAFGVRSEKLKKGDFVLYNSAVGCIVEEGIQHRILFEGELDTESEHLAPNLLEKTTFKIEYFEKPFLAIFGFKDTEKGEKDTELSFVNVIGQSESHFYVALPNYITENEKREYDFLKRVHYLNNNYYSRSLFIPRSKDDEDKLYDFSEIYNNASLFSGKKGVLAIEKKHIKRVSVANESAYDFVNAFTDNTEDKMICSIRNFITAFGKHDYMRLSKHTVNTFSILFYFKNSKKDFLNEFYHFSNMLFEFYNDRYIRNDMDFSEFLFNHLKQSVKIYDALS